MADIGNSETQQQEHTVNTPEPVSENPSNKVNIGSENKKSEESIGTKRIENLNKIKSGEDKVGSRIYREYQLSLEDKDVGDTSRLYVDARDSVRDINNVGEANKAVVAINALYKTLGREGYKIDSKDIPADISPEERKKFIRDKIEMDFNNLSEKLADKFIEDYINSSVDLQDAKDDLKKKISLEEISRTEVRRASYKAEDKTTKLLYIVEKNAVDIGKEDLGEELKDDIKTREWVIEYVGVKEFNQLDQEDRTKLLNDSFDKYRGSLSAEKQREVGLLDRMNENRKNQAFIPIAEVDQKISNLRQDLEKNVNAEAWDICEKVSELKELQLKRRTLVTKVSLILVDQRIEEARTGLKDRWKNTLNSFTRSRNRTKALGDLLNSGKEWVSSHVAVIGEGIRKGVGDTLNSMDFKMEGQKDNVAEVLRNIDESFFLDMRNKSSSVAEKISESIVGARKKALLIRSDVKSSLINAEYSIYKKIHEEKISLQENKVKLFAKGRRLSLETSTRFAGVIGQSSERTNLRLQAIERFSENEIRNKKNVIAENNKNNPLFKRFEDDLEKRLGLIEKVKNIQAEKENVTIPEEIIQEPIITMPGEIVNQRVENPISDKDTSVDQKQKNVEDLKMDNKTDIKTREEYEKEQAMLYGNIEERFLSALDQISTIKKVFPDVLEEKSGERIQIGGFESEINFLLNTFQDEQDLDRRKTLLEQLDKNVKGMQNILDNLF